MSIQLSAETPALVATPAPLGKPGGPGLYRLKGAKLPNYIENMRNALMRGGMTEAHATAVAINACKKLAVTSKHPEVKAAAAGAIAELKSTAARAHAAHGTSPGPGALSNTKTALEFVGPKGYEHGWIKVGLSGLPAKHGVVAGDQIEANHSQLGSVTGTVNSVGSGGVLSVSTGTSSYGFGPQSDVTISPKDVTAIQKAPPPEEQASLGAGQLFGGLMRGLRIDEKNHLRSGMGTDYGHVHGAKAEVHKIGIRKSVLTITGENGKSKTIPLAGTLRQRWGMKTAAKINSLSNDYPSSVLDLVGPEGYSHGWVFHGIPGTTPHSDLLRMRKESKVLPKGHPERVKAERAVRESRRLKAAGGTMQGPHGAVSGIKSPTPPNRSELEAMLQRAKSDAARGMPGAKARVARHTKAIKQQQLNEVLAAKRTEHVRRTEPNPTRGMSPAEKKEYDEKARTFVKTGPRNRRGTPTTNPRTQRITASEKRALSNILAIHPSKINQSNINELRQRARGNQAKSTADRLLAIQQEHGTQAAQQAFMQEVGNILGGRRRRR